MLDIRSLLSTVQRRPVRRYLELVGRVERYFEHFLMSGAESGDVTMGEFSEA